MRIYEHNRQWEEGRAAADWRVAEREKAGRMSESTQEDHPVDPVLGRW